MTVYTRVSGHALRTSGGAQAHSVTTLTGLCHQPAQRQSKRDICVAHQKGRMKRSTTMPVLKGIKQEAKCLEISLVKESIL